MRLLVVRHAIAEDKETFARTNANDDERPLTAEGRRKMRVGAAALASLVPDPDVLATSPLTRAMQTAKILARAYDNIDVTVAAELEPDVGVKACIAWLRTHDEDATVIIVGHEPDLGALVSALLAPKARSFIEFGKGGACLLECDGPAIPGAATLEWLLAPGELRRLAPRKRAR